MELLMQQEEVRIYSVNCCPECGNGMEQVSLIMGEPLITRVTFGAVKVKRFLCLVCLSEKNKYYIKKNN